MFKFSRRLLLAATVASLAVPASAADTVKIGQTFLTQGLDPARGSAGWALTTHGVGQNLFTVGRNGRVLALLATGATRIDALNWRVALQTGVRFSDGTPADAAAIAEGLNRVSSENAVARASAGALTFKAIDAATLQVTSERPAPHLPSILAEWVFVVSRQTPAGPVFTGAWKVQGFEPDRELRLEPNPHFAGADQRPNIRIRRFTDGQSLALAAQSGEVDLAFNVPGEALPRLRATPGLTVTSFPVAYQTMAWLNMQRPVLSDVRVRRAIDLAIDRRLLIAAVQAGEAASSAYARTFPFATMEPRPFDMAAAARLLDEAGWRLDGAVRRKDGQPLRLTVVAYPQRPELVTFQPVLVSEFRKLGIEVETRVVDNPQAVARDGAFDILLWAQHTAPAGDPAFFPGLFLRTGAANNFVRYSSPALDATLDRFSTAADVELRAEISLAAEKIVFADAPVAYLVTPSWHIVTSARLRGYEPWGSDYYIIRPDLRVSR
jgi:peptide/nickel transport system substrate-binding protein